MSKKIAGASPRGTRIALASTRAVSDIESPSTPADNGSPAGALADENGAPAHGGRRTRPIAPLCLRPASGDLAEADALLRIAETIDVGATRPDREAISADLLATRRALDENLHSRDAVACFVTRGLGLGDGEAIVGSCKLGSTESMAWHRTVERRTTWGGRKAEYFVFELEHSGSSAVELSGNAVDPALRRNGIGRFQVQARLLFLHLHPSPQATDCYANLLAPEVSGEYPLYEAIVKPLLGGMDYDEADRLRYRTTAEIVSLLKDGKAGGPRFPAHLVPAGLRPLMGVAKPLVGSVQAALESYGLRPNGHFDLLDFGPLLSASLRQVKRQLAPERLSARPARGPLDRGTWRTLAAEGPATEFSCVRSLVRTVPAESVVELDEQALAALGSSEGDPLILVAER
jgi:arginine/ornithine N-succinyltransferase beta subunit